MFCLQMTFKDFFKLILSFKVRAASHVQIRQNDKFAISLQYLKEGNDELNFLHRDKHESFL